MQYTKIKDSGFADLGYVPRHWLILRIKNRFSIICGATPSENAENWDGDISWITPADMSDWGDITHGKRKISQRGYESCGTTLVPAGTVILSTRAPIGKIQIAQNEICTNQGCKSLQLKFPEDSTKYLSYYLLTICRQLQEAGTGTTFKELSINSLKNVPYLLPTPTEQSAIADYLDEKCGVIDEIIEQAKATIEEYKAWKSSVIFEAVTKGLDPNAEMKDSGVEWIGKMPETWELKPFRYFLHERTEKNSPVKSTERLSLSIELGVTLYSEKTTNLDRFKDDFKQYKLAHEGDLVMNSMNMIVGASGVSKYFGCVSPAYYTFYDKLPDHASAKYCEYVFRSKAMLRILYSLGRGIYAIERGDDRVNTCRLKVPKEDLKALLLPSPAIKEQRKIVNYLDRKCSAIDEIIAEKEALIADMDAYKKSLIFETVTGKRKVC